MAKGVASGKRKSHSKPSASEPAGQAEPAAPPSQTISSNDLKRYEIPADFEENLAPLKMETDFLDMDSELWLFQLPHEVDPAEALTWHISKTEGGVSGSCQDAEGVSYTLVEEPSDMASSIYTTPAAGSKILSRFQRRVTVVKANQLPDALAEAQAVEAVMPSADMTGMPPASQSHAALIHQVPNATIQKQQQQQDQQAGQDLLATPVELQSKHKKQKSEAKKLKKRAQEATAVNEKQSKLQRQSDAPVLTPEAVQVSAGPEVRSEAAHLQQQLDAPASAEGKQRLKSKKYKKQHKEKSDKKKHKQKDK